MKTSFALVLVAIFTSCLASAQAVTEQEMMAEMEKCAVCKHLAAKPELMKDMTWETHKIDNGMLCVSTVPTEQMSAFKEMNKEMEAAVEEVTSAAQEGKSVEVCEFCAGWGELLKSGAKEKQISLTNGMIHMFTSDDPAVVAKIHAEADKAIELQKQIAQK
jgi:hypothetical protein